MPVGRGPLGGPQSQRDRTKARARAETGTRARQEPAGAGAGETWAEAQGLRTPAPRSSRVLIEVHDLPPPRCFVLDLDCGVRSAACVARSPGRASGRQAVCSRPHRDPDVGIRRAVSSRPQRPSDSALRDPPTAPPHGLDGLCDGSAAQPRSAALSAMPLIRPARLNDQPGPAAFLPRVHPVFPRAGARWLGSG